LLVEISPYFIPILSPAHLATYAAYYSGIPLFLVTLVAFQFRLRRIRDDAERRFWNLWTLGYGVWLVQQVWTGLPGVGSGYWYDVLDDLFFVLFYLLIILALQVEPHLHQDPTTKRRLEALESAGAAVFVFGLLAYFVVIPASLDREAFFTYASSLTLCVVLDGFIVLRLFRLARASTSRWRALYAWLLATAVLWLATDAVETLMTAGVIPWVASGTRLDLLWLTPYVPVLVAARLKDCPWESGAEREPGGEEDASQDQLAGMATRPLVLFAAGLPILHLLLSSFGAVDPATRPAREMLALVLLLVLAGMAMAHQRSLFGEIRRADELRARATKAERRAYHDSLTGLPNRYLLLDRLEQALPRARRSGNKVAVLFLDLDRFKVINDSLGHTAGDRLLQDVGARLGRLVRSGDTLARFGGDEFTILVESIHHTGDTAKIAQHLLEAVRERFLVAERELFITASIGISVYPDDSQDAESLIRNADVAMYRVKEQGRDGYRLFAGAMNEQALERLQMEASLRKALGQGQFLLQYQPIVRVSTGRVDGCEALLRWRHPTKGVLRPDDFLELAELTGVITPVGSWVLETACKEASGWPRGDQGPLSVAVNLSARQFRAPGLVQQIEKALSEAALDPRLLEVEITEGLAMENAATTIETLRRLKGLGVRISIDDFGTGYSSLSYLKHFPIDILKIDQAFVRELHASEADAAIAATVIAMGRTMGLGVLAEGVEKDEQLAVLRRLGCERVQGYLLSPPLWPGELGPFLGRT